MPKRKILNLQLQKLLEPFGITHDDTDYWGAYTCHLEASEHRPGTRHTQQIERKPLTLRTRIKRLARTTICFSQSIAMHDIIIGLFVNRCELGYQYDIVQSTSVTSPLSFSSDHVFSAALDRRVSAHG